jgi:hypothetical protein
VPSEPPPPSGVTDAFQAKVDAWGWTYEDGLVPSLRMFAGEALLSDLFPEPPANLEGFGVVREAQRYLRAGDDDAAKAESERLLDILAPPPGVGTYTSDGVSNLTFALVKDAVTIAQDLYMNGQKMAEGPIDQGGLGGSTGAAAVYSCDDEAGELLINYAPSTDLPPILFNRVSKTP